MDPDEPASEIMSDMGRLQPGVEHNHARLAEIREALSAIHITRIRLIVFGIIWDRNEASVRGCLENSGYDASGPLNIGAMTEQGVVFLPVPGTGRVNGYAREIVYRLYTAIPAGIVILAFGQSYTYGGALVRVPQRHTLYKYKTEWAVSGHAKSILFCDAFIRVAAAAGVDWSPLFSGRHMPLLRDPMFSWATGTMTAIPPGHGLVAVCTYRRRAWAMVIALCDGVWYAYGLEADPLVRFSDVVASAASWITARGGLPLATCELVSDNRMVNNADRLAHALQCMSGTICAFSLYDFRHAPSGPDWSVEWVHSSCYAAARICCMRAKTGRPGIWPPLRF